MGCGCGGRKAEASTPADPIRLGADPPEGPQPAQRMTATVNVGPMRRGDTGWVTGSQVAGLAEKGYLVAAEEPAPVA